MALLKEFSLIKVYLLLISIAGIIGTVVGFGNLAHQTLKIQIISNQEYIYGGNYWEITQCDEPKYMPTRTEPTIRTPEEITKCKQDAEKRVLDRRAYDYKDNVIAGGVWGTLFLLLFITHFPIFLRKNKERAE